MKALIVLDVQRESMKCYPAALLAEINARISFALQQDWYILYAKNVRHLRSGTSIYPFAEDLNVCSPHVFYKEKASLFSCADFEAFLRTNCLSELELAGIDGNSCVFATAMDARKRGLKVSLFCPAIGVKNAARFSARAEAFHSAGIILLP